MKSSVKKLNCLLLCVGILKYWKYFRNIGNISEMSHLFLTGLLVDIFTAMMFPDNSTFLVLNNTVYTACNSSNTTLLKR